MSARIVAEAAAVAKHPVAGNDDGEGIARAGLADGARTGLNPPRHLAVACTLAMGNGDHGGAQHFPALASGGSARQVAHRTPPCKLRLALPARVAHTRVTGDLLATRRSVST